MTKTKQRWLIPETVQTSAMDCGPASLKCLLEGYGTPISYGRLREACQTDVDGTSINTIEDVAVQLGLDAEQVMLPVDHLLLAESNVLPAIAVTIQPGGATHFIIIWRRHGRWVQVMDPGVGRRWLDREELLNEIYRHEMTVPADQWREWAASSEFLNPMRRRMEAVGTSSTVIELLIAEAVADSTWRSLAALDAATRMTDSIVRAGGLRRGRQAESVLRALHEGARFGEQTEKETVPANYWSVRALPGERGEKQQLRFRGAVLISVRGRRTVTSKAGDEWAAAEPLSPDLVTALAEKPSRPGRELLEFLKQDGLLTPAIVVVALLLAASGVLMEAVLFQGLFDLTGKLRSGEQRLGAMMVLLVFTIALLFLELPLIGSLLRFGRRLETRLRVAFLQKIPRLGDRYFHSRLISDMAERSHSVYTLRMLPVLGGRLLRLVFELSLTAAAMIWLDPSAAPVIAVAASAAVVLPLVAQTRLTERDLRMRNHSGALCRFYLDALLGLIAIRTHGAAAAVGREHESLQVEWARAGYGLLRVSLAVEAAQSLVGFGLTAWLLFDHLGRSGESGGTLLLIYWALNLPVMGQEISLIAQQYPALRNVTLRLLEPLGAPEDKEERKDEGETRKQGERPMLGSLPQPAAAWAGATSDSRLVRVGTPAITNQAVTTFDGERLAIYERGLDSSHGIHISLEEVSVRAAGNLILDGIDLTIEAGSHVGIVGASGAGKSSLVGLLLGWHRPASGRIMIDGEALDRERLEVLRQETAWVDPAVQLWNRSLIENLRYGAANQSRWRAPARASDESARPRQSAICNLQSAIEGAELRRVLEKLPDGLQTSLGEGGGLVSGGEGQRVRLARAMLRPGVRLVILDEPFRGLDRERRREMLARARRLWRGATLLCITHDVGETMDFERVLVVDGGRIVEDGSPTALAGQPWSRYHALLRAEKSVRRGLWASSEWRRWRLDDGRLSEDVAEELVS